MLMQNPIRHHGLMHSYEFGLNVVRILRLDTMMDRELFTCGKNLVIDNILRQFNLNQDSQHKLYAAICDETVIGFYAINSSVAKIYFKDKNNQNKINFYTQPSINIEAIAVHKDWQNAKKGRKIGTLLFLHCCEVTTEISQLLGVSLLSLTAVNRKVADYYHEKWGFQYANPDHLAKSNSEIEDIGIPMQLDIGTVWEIVKKFS
ncbi:MAG: GNAT family N-acetyltransferase [Candidatus Symbiobacter sp.]|nr:GNAT family N-acetyltransferase [Candidatus Symbiobacter sp.]